MAASKRYVSEARRGTSFPSYLRRIPADIAHELHGSTLVIPCDAVQFSIAITSKTQSIRFSLRTKSPVEARKRERKITEYLDGLFARLRTKQVVELSHRQIQALSGSFYAAWASEPDRFPDRLLYADGLGLPCTAPEDYDAEAKKLRQLSETLRDILQPSLGDAPLAPLLRVSDTLLMLHGIPKATEASRRHLAKALAKELPEAIATRARFAEGDYRTDERLSRFPAWEDIGLIAPATTHTKRRSSSITLSSLLNGWWSANQSLGKSVATHEKYVISFKHLKDFLRHDEASAVTSDDIRKFRDERLKTVSPVTIRSSLIAFKSVFAWAVDQRFMDRNPAEGIAVQKGKKVKLRDREFTDKEATAILRHANTLRNDPNLSDTGLGKRWVPWLCAYTGARVGEIVQLRKEDIRQDKGAWVITISPKAGSVKTGEAREVPLHAHVIEQGFLDFVKASPSGYLFIHLKKGASFRQTWRGRKNVIAAFVREVVPDPNVAPNHGWRHSFKSRGFEADIQEKVLDAICGHAPASVGRSYGSVSLKTKIDAIAKFPRYEV